MRVSVILAHPCPGSFNHAIANSALQILRRNGHQVAFHDLHQEGFDPLLVCEEIPRVARPWTRPYRGTARRSPLLMG